MRYQLHDKLVSFGGGSIIQDTAGNDVYTVDTKGISLSKKLVFKDLQGNVLADIQQKVFSFSATFEVVLSHGLSAKMTRKGSFGRDQLKIGVNGQDDMEARGNFAQHDYTIFHSGRQVARVSKTLSVPGNGLGDPYGMEIDDKEEQVLLLCSAVVIDAIHDLETD